MGGVGGGGRESGRQKLDSRILGSVGKHAKDVCLSVCRFPRFPPVSASPQIPTPLLCRTHVDKQLV